MCYVENTPSHSKTCSVVHAEIVHLIENNNVKQLEKVIAGNARGLESRDIEEALLQAVMVGASDAIPLLVMAGARK